LKEVDMRTQLASLVVITAALSGCATARRVQGLQPAPPPPLQVWIGYPIGSSHVFPIFTNRPAHVAMFEILPGRGATMVYPHLRPDAFASDAHYADLTLQPGRMFYASDPFGHAALQPRYYYAVASSAPLNLARLQASLGAMRRVLGRTYSSYRPYDVIDRLTKLVVPMQTDEDWATDLFIDWPMPPMPVFALDRYRSVRCANGRVIQVASNYPYYGCPGDAELAVVASAPELPAKEASREGPRVPRRGRGREGIELSAPGIDKRRRAEAGAQPPRSGSVTQSPGEGIRYSDEGPARVRDASPGGAASRSPASQPASTEKSSERSRTVERSEPVSKPAVERSEPVSRPAAERGEPRKEKP
jgi:hypothetical protein